MEALLAKFLDKGRSFVYKVFFKYNNRLLKY